MTSTQNKDPWKSIEVEPIPRTALRPAEAAESLGVSERTLADWMKEPGFPLIKIGGCRLIPVAELRTWLTDQVRDKEAA